MEEPARRVRDLTRTGERAPVRVAVVRRWPSGHANFLVTYVPLGIIALALIALVVVPSLGEGYARRHQQELRGAAEPARGLVTKIHLALALGGDALHDFVATADTSFLDRYRQTATQEQRTYADLIVLSEPLGAEVEERFIALLNASARWHENVEVFLMETAASEPRRRAVLAAGLYEDVLIAAARLDDAITHASQLRRQRIVAAERVEMRLTSVVAVMAMLALAMVAWVGRRLRLIAAEAESRRQEVERLMEGRARLVRGLSHDLRNPLNVIYSHAQLLEDGVIGDPSTEQKRSLAHIRRSVRALIGLIEDLLELWRVETGELAPLPARTDLDALVRDVAEAYRALAESENHRIEVESLAELPHVDTDARRVRQVLGNLVSNAIKYTPAGGCITIRLRARTGVIRSRRGRWVAIEVSDTGPGIPPDKVDAIFEEFTRLRPSVPGVGLGLAISRRIARMLGGDLTVVVGAEHGSTFVLSLPLLTREVDSEVDPTAGQTDGASGPGVTHEAVAR